jgi:Fic family protein
MRQFDYSKAREELFTPEIVNILAKIHEYKGKQELFIAAKPDILNAMLEVAKIQSTGASNRIEGIYTSEARLSKLVKGTVEPKNRNEQEIVGYREVLNTIHESYEHIVPRSNVILQLHRDLYTYSPSSIGGHFKNSDNLIEEIDSLGQKRIRFEPLSAFETPEALERLSNELIEALKEGKIDSLLLIAMFILDFLCIHPFNDGNGRMSRLLTLLFLYRERYIAGKYISLEMFIEKTKDSYYDALEHSSIGWHENRNSYAPFVSYYLGIILSVYKEFENRVEYVRSIGTTKAERIRKTFEGKLGKITKSEIATICPDISIAMIEKTLADLLSKGYIQKIGSGRATGYVRNLEG